MLVHDRCTWLCRGKGDGGIVIELRNRFTAALVELLKGSAILWGKGSRSAVEQARARGVLHGLVNNCSDAEEVAWLQRHGYLTGRYDNRCWARIPASLTQSTATATPC